MMTPQQQIAQELTCLPAIHPLNLDEALIKILSRANPSLWNRINIEYHIAKSLILFLRYLKFTVEADNGEDDPEDSTIEQMLDVLFSVDESTLRVRPPGGKRTFVFLVFGNDGWDLIADYGMSIDAEMESFMAWVETQGEGFMS